MEEQFPELFERLRGPFSARLFVQPFIALVFAFRDGRSDARQDAPPFLWALVFKAGERRERIRGAWGSVGTVAIMAFVLDCVFQYVADGNIRIAEALAMALILCVIPYTLVRGPVSRIARSQPIPILVAAAWVLICLVGYWLAYRMAFAVFWELGATATAQPEPANAATWLPDGTVILAYAAVLVLLLVLGYTLYASGFRVTVPQTSPVGPPIDPDAKPAHADEAAGQYRRKIMAGSERDPEPVDVDAGEPAADVPQSLPSADNSGESAYTSALLRVLVHVALADGKLLNVEVRRVIEIFNGIADIRLSKERFEAELADVRDRGGGANLEGELDGLLPHIDGESREFILQAAARVMVSDQNIDKDEWNLLWEIAGMLGLTESRFKELVNRELPPPNE